MATSRLIRLQINIQKGQIESRLKKGIVTSNLTKT